MGIQAVRFKRDNTTDFAKVLRTRVKGYFKEKNISKHANSKMVIKTIFMISLYFIPYGIFLSGAVESYWGMVGLYLIMGLGLAGIGLSIMHDANHGAYSKNEKVNNFIGKILNVVGGYDFNWRTQHNVLHHSFTNIEGYDEDIDPGTVLRFSPHAERKKAHKYQHYYAWFFYSLMTFLWITFKDFVQLNRYKRMGLIEGGKKGYRLRMLDMILWKVFYYAYMVAIPLLVLDIDWWMMPILLISMHLVAGLILACIFQPAHVVPDTHFPLPSQPDNNIENVWFAHQLETTANFAPKNKVLSWYVGGLNYQVEHHLFPSICHVHYPEISKIVEKTAKEFNLPYHSFETFRGALVAHTRMLRDLGRYDQLPNATYI